MIRGGSRDIVQQNNKVIDDNVIITTISTTTCTTTAATITTTTTVTPTILPTIANGVSSSGGNGSETTNIDNKIVQFKSTGAGTGTVAEELLGSVKTSNCPGTRASARVIQKLKQDQTRPLTPPPQEREHGKKDEKSTQKTPSQMRAANKTTWTNLERNCFFDALNEFGKDFDAVSICINAKLKRRTANNDYSVKTKDQVRQHYYQTYHKISKYVPFSDELKKPVQELYTLINYGEMRRKLQFLTEKHFLKLRPLIYEGLVTVRCKGKNIRIKTPSCKALRRLNQLEDSLEDIRLPNKIEVVISPANMDAFGRVQSLAQNPRSRITVPLHKKLATLLQIFQQKWRSAEARLADEKIGGGDSSYAPFTDAALCFHPKPGVAIHRPLLSITAFLSSGNICLSSYEERLGIKVRSETLERSNAVNSKRPRTESGSEKRSPEAKKPKASTSPPHEKSSADASVSVSEAIKEDTLDGSNNNNNGDISNATMKMESSSGDELSDEIQAFVNETFENLTMTVTTTATATTTTTTTAAAASSSSTTTTTTSSHQSRGKGGKGGGAGGRHNGQNFRPLISDDVVKRMRKGWTMENAADITMGDLYIVLGQDSKLELDYCWIEPKAAAAAVTQTQQTAPTSLTTGTGMPYNTNDCDSAERVKAVTTAALSNKLKHLLLVANLSERVRKRQCNCSYNVDRVAATLKTKRDLMISKAQWLAAGATTAASATAGATTAAGGGGGGADGHIFRVPMPPLRPPNIVTDPVRQLSSIMRQKLARQVLVQRRILPHASNAPSCHIYDVQSGLPIELPPSISSTGTIDLPSATSNCPMNKNKIENPVESYGSDYGSTAAYMDMPDLDALPEAAQDESSTQSLFNGSVSPMQLLRDSTSNARWMDDNINDFSLTSLLGHLDEMDATGEVLNASSGMSIISETSVDFRHKFQEFSALLQSQEKD